MLLFYLLLTLYPLDSSAIYYEEICYGSKYSLPIHVIPVVYKGPITYTPKNGQPKIVVNNTQSLDPRFKVDMQIKMIDLTEQDNGGILTSETRFYDNIQLRVKVCREPEVKPYGESISWKIPNEAEYLEFSKYHPEDPVQPIILWNHTGLSLGRGKVRRDYYEIKNLKQQDNGYYRFRGSKNQLLKWQQLQVTEHRQNYDFEEGDYVYITYPGSFTPSEVQFTPKGTEERRTIKADSRVEITDEYFVIEDVRTDEAGTYYFLDDHMNIVLQVDLIVNLVEAEEPYWVDVVMVAVPICVIFLCCWSMKRCCCKNSSDKRNNSDDQTEAAAPHDTTHPSPPALPLLHREPTVSPGPPYPTQPTHPPPYSYQPTSTFSDPPPTYNFVLAEINPPPAAQVSASGGLGASSSTNYNFISSDSEPTFDLTGVTSAPPLSAETSISTEYTSDKLNFM